MWEYDPEEATRNRECSEAYRFRRLATDSILALLPEQATPEHYQQALSSLLALKDDRVSRLDAFHRSPFYGRHRCIEEAYVSVRLHIQCALQFQPPPQPERAPDPAPEPPRRSLREVLEHFENVTETYLGDKLEGEDRD
jgi:hypothetical protein